MPLRLFKGQVELTLVSAQVASLTKKSGDEIRSADQPYHREKNCMKHDQALALSLSPGRVSEHSPSHTTTEVDWHTLGSFPMGNCGPPKPFKEALCPDFIAARLTMTPEDPG